MACIQLKTRLYCLLSSVLFVEIMTTVWAGAVALHSNVYLHLPVSILSAAGAGLTFTCIAALSSDQSTLQIVWIWLHPISITLNYLFGLYTLVIGFQIGGIKSTKDENMLAIRTISAGCCLYLGGVLQLYVWYVVRRFREVYHASTGAGVNKKLSDEHSYSTLDLAE